VVTSQMGWIHHRWGHYITEGWLHHRCLRWGGFTTDGSVTSYMGDGITDGMVKSQM